MFADLGTIVVDCCSVEKEVMQKGSKKNYDFFVARIEGSEDPGIGGSEDRAACRFHPCCTKK
jgi:hypothetical protein